MPENISNPVLKRYLALAQKLRKHCATLDIPYGQEYNFPTFKILIFKDSVQMLSQIGNFLFSITDDVSNPEYLISVISRGPIRVPICGYYNKKKEHTIKAQRQDISNPDIDILEFIKRELKLATPQNVKSYSSYVSELRQALDFFRDIFELEKAQTPNEYLKNQQHKQECYQQIHNILNQHLSQIGDIKLSDLLKTNLTGPTQAPNNIEK